MPPYTVAELAERVAGSVEGDAERTLTGVAPIAEAGPAHLSFIQSDQYRRLLDAARPGAVLAPPGMEITRPDVTVIRVPDPQVAFGRLVELFKPPPPPPVGIAESASIGRGARLGADVTIGPYAQIRDGARIGDGCHIGAYTVVGESARIGRGCRIAHGCSVLHDVQLGDRVVLHPGVRVGTDGFGYAEGPSGAEKVPQVGGCVIGDDVEIGANSTIDRGSLGDTVVGDRTKIDNLVHIGHNVEVGSDCMIVAQVGIAGSVKIGDGAALAGQVGVAGHLEIGPGARIGAQAGVIGDVPPGAVYSGYPARPHREALRASAALFRLPRLVQKLQALERAMNARANGPQASDDDGKKRGTGS
jgi:UDP-3-O-[3-hydroxymyristoyl] glucosamine N-acyltransferase